MLYKMAQKQKSLLILINPYSGTKVAQKLFKTIVKPELEQRHLSYEVVETEYAGMYNIKNIFYVYHLELFGMSFITTHVVLCSFTVSAILLRIQNVFVNT